jgi:hypothetical protein
MRNARRLTAVLWLALSCLLFGSSCILSEESPQTPDSPTGEAAEEIGGFSPSLFAFTTLVADDGEGLAGGWQEATATLNFRDLSYTPNPKSWQCRIKVGMPIRSTSNGIILPEYAAQISAAKATNASSIVMHSQPEWPIAEQFCRASMDEMLRGIRLYELGATVSRP